MPTYRTETTLDFGVLGEHNVDVLYNYSEAQPATRLDPSEDASVEVVSVNFKTEHGIIDVIRMLTDRAYECMCDELLEDGYDRALEHKACAAEEAWERDRDDRMAA